MHLLEKGTMLLMEKLPGVYISFRRVHFGGIFYTRKDWNGVPMRIQGYGEAIFPVWADDAFLSVGNREHCQGTIKKTSMHAEKGIAFCMHRCDVSDVFLMDDGQYGIPTL